MPTKHYIDPNIGEIVVYKRISSKKISLRVSNNKIKVFQPKWLSFYLGFKFAKSHESWIIEQKNNINLKKIENGQLVGKKHIINFVKSDKNRGYIKNNSINIYFNVEVNTYKDQIIQDIAKKTIKRALHIEAKDLLTERIKNISRSNNIYYSELRVRPMRSRWGSCDSKKNITLNIYLMLMPWDLIDYVIVHELIHTKVLNHSADFWNQLYSIMPDYKLRKQNINKIHNEISYMQI